VYGGSYFLLKLYSFIGYDAIENCTAAPGANQPPSPQSRYRISRMSGFSRELNVAACAMLGHRPAGLAYATIDGSAAFGAICGSSTAAVGRLRKWRFRKCGAQLFGKVSQAGRLPPVER
jgi:hypothetical protein